MYKLLLVDDEILTRESIISRLSKENIQMGPIEQADNGIMALEIISKGFRPDILLTDLRMPVMDGIELCFKIKQILPRCKVIFMSGFSDKEYLMSAIQLQVINYIEKPLEYSELILALKAAVAECEKDSQKQRYEKVFHQSIPFIKNEFALRLIKKYEDFSLLNEWLELAKLQPFQLSYFRTVIINIFASSNFSLSEIENDIEPIFSKFGLTGISAIKDDEHLIIHLSADSVGRNLLESQNSFDMFREISEHLTNFSDRFFISVGNIVTEVSDIPDSYQTAVLALQKAFFYGYRSVIFYKNSSSSQFIFRESELEDLEMHLSSNDRERAALLIKRLTSEIRCCDTTNISYITDTFFKLMLRLYKYASGIGINLDNNNGEEHLWKTLSQLHTLNELEEFSLCRLNDFFHILNDRSTTKSTIADIIKFIHQNYNDNELSIKSISEHAFLNLNYLCSLFKHETGKTVNQFITEYRIEKAKEILKNRQIKVTDVAEQVGYKDGTYFAKIFRKATSLSPSEYRERYRP